ncbi:MAG: hypoxanthine phosphoribosyltransferase [Oscillospiraceae bacterium]|jgi:hypoxanthine phosphoribosyltransferase|nr:hypoxanthine phosphoribosyltransferase [Oscillospiraceae bacterium]
MHPDIERILLSEETLAARVRALAEEISVDFAGRRPLFVGVLKGAFIFLGDLVRHVTLPCGIDFLAVSSYGRQAVTAGAVRIVKDVDGDIRGRDVVIVEDILDSGLTLSYIISLMNARKPASVSVCTLMDKPDRRKVPVEARYTGFCVPDEFVVGYGLDYANRFRNLPYVGVLKRAVYL